MSDSMKHYEVTLIVDPVLSGEEIKTTAQTYVDHLKNEGCEIVHVDEMGLRQLAYPIKKRTSGVYSCVEFSTETGEFIDNFELALRRDERIVRFLTVKLDKYGVKYNEDKRNGLIGKVKKKEKPKRDDRNDRRRDSRDSRDTRKPRPPRNENRDGGAPQKEAAEKEEATKDN